MILDEEIKSFLMDSAEDMQKVLIQEIRDKFIEKVDDKIVWKQGFRVRMQEIEELKEQHKQSVKQAYDNIVKEKCYNYRIVEPVAFVKFSEIEKIFKDIFAFGGKHED